MSANSETPPVERRQRVTGSDMSRKQLGRAAADGQLVTYNLVGGLPSVTGYLVGMDDFHWHVVTTEGREVLIHKGMTPLVMIHPEPTLSGSTVEERVNEIGSAFRSYCLRTYVPPRKDQN